MCGRVARRGVSVMLGAMAALGMSSCASMNGPPGYEGPPSGEFRAWMGYWDAQREADHAQWRAAHGGNEMPSCADDVRLCSWMPNVADEIGYR